MTNEDVEEFTGLMVGIAENFSAELSDVGLKLRFDAMKDLSMQQVKRAVNSIVRSRKYTKMPTIAEFLEHIHGSPEDKATMEATKVLQAIKRIGGHESVCFDDPVTQAVIQQAFGGWVKMCSDLVADKENWFLKDFVKTWTAFAREGVQEFGHLPGVSEVTNNANGYIEHLPAPLLIGNTAKARKVLEAPKPATVTGPAMQLVERIAANG